MARTSEDLLGESRSMKRVRDLVAHAATFESPVLVTGESGTGKEMVAREIHRRSRRSGGPFVAVHCSAMPAALVESELFGHVRGAFTSATGDRSGLLATAAGGTVLLDEIGDTPLEVQSKLLRVLQDRRIRRVGSDEEIGIDIRVIAASNRDLEVEVMHRHFRLDVYFRLNVIDIVLPPLREREGDVLMLAQHFAERIAAQRGGRVRALSESAAKKLLAYGWPGNVRELQNCIERATAFARSDRIEPEDLPDRMCGSRVGVVPLSEVGVSALETMEQVECRYIAQVLERVRWNKTLAANVLGFDRKRLERKIRRYGILAAQRPPES